MTMLDTRQTVARIVLDHSECAPVFQRHRIDFCCRGEMTVEAACEERRVDIDAIRDELERAIAERRGEPSTDPRAMSTAALVAHIVTRHHAYLRKTLPFVQPLAAKVARVHGDHNPRLRELQGIVDELTSALLPHLDAEEQVLFPMMMMREREEERLSRELWAMRDDHLAVGRLLERMRDATESYAVPEWACGSYRTLFAELAKLEDDVLRHVHVENHVLLPRFARSDA
jgi:regulator of cell morphogenesis and NO signaling